MEVDLIMSCPLSKEYCNGCAYFEEHHRFFDPIGPLWKSACAYYWPDYREVYSSRLRPQQKAKEPVSDINNNIYQDVLKRINDHDAQLANLTKKQSVEF